uniref:Putative RdRp n=1 Tax=Cyathus narnavirus A TaxID=2592755 RepID=A0A7G3KHT7_9VIRU|nr:putative RdRp [Cyathus narnavirus A]
MYIDLCSLSCIAKLGKGGHDSNDPSIDRRRKNRGPGEKRAKHADLLEGSWPGQKSPPQGFKVHYPCNSSSRINGNNADQCAFAKAELVRFRVADKRFSSIKRAVRRLFFRGEIDSSGVSFRRRPQFRCSAQQNTLSSTVIHNDSPWGRLVESVLSRLQGGEIENHPQTEPCSPKPPLEEVKSESPPSLYPPSLLPGKSSQEVLLDFFSESSFETYAKQFREAQRRANWCWKQYQDSGSDHWIRAIGKAVDRAQHCSNVLYGLFAQALGVRDHKVPIRRMSFSKREYDSAMETCFGSLNKAGSGWFKVFGIIDLDSTMDLSASKIFSLYLLRKVLVVADPREIPKKDSEFLERISSLPTPPTERYCVDERFPAEISELIAGSLLQDTGKDGAILIMEHLCRLLFTSKSATKYPRFEYVPNSGKACTEVPLSRGGKRAAIYLRSADFVLENRFATIVSGGKFRTITIDSARNARDYEFLNDYMFRIVRKLPCMISGKTVEEWFDSVEIPQGSWVLSGDLEAATDHFRSDLAECVIRHLTDLFFDGSEVHFERMCAFTTRAVFREEGEQTVQRRGQLMGSVLSFPILCLVNLVSQLMMRYSLVRVLSMTRKDLFAFNLCGINGDDVVTWGEESVRESWLESLGHVGGVPSRGKTLFSQTHFTVNSELFSVLRGKLRVLRPSLIVAMHEGAFKAPQETWLEYLYSPIRSESADRIFRPERVLFPNFPVSWGGTGIHMLDSFSEYNFVEACYLRACKTRPFEGFADTACPAPGVHVQGKSTTVYLGGEVKDFSSYSTVGGFMRKDEVRKIARLKYGVKKLAYWTDPTSRRKTLEQIMDETQDMYQSLTSYQRDLLYREYKEAFEMERNGFVYVRSIIDCGQERVRPRWQGRVFTRPIVETPSQPDELTQYGWDIHEYDEFSQEEDRPPDVLDRIVPMNMMDLLFEDSEEVEEYQYEDWRPD